MCGVDFFWNYFNQKMAHKNSEFSLIKDQNVLHMLKQQPTIDQNKREIMGS